MLGVDSMPRGVRKQIDIKSEIKKIDDEITALQKKREALLAQRKDTAMKSLTSFLSENDIPLMEAVDFLSAAAAAAATDNPSPEI